MFKFIYDSFKLVAPALAPLITCVFCTLPQARSISKIKVSFLLSKRTFISGYDMEDIQNECYRILLRCLSLYKMDAFSLLCSFCRKKECSVYSIHDPFIKFKCFATKNAVKWRICQNRLFHRRMADTQQ